MRQQPYYTCIEIDNHGNCRTFYKGIKYVSKFYLSCETYVCIKKCCCKPKKKCVIIRVPDIFIEAKEINCCFIRGFVKCSTDQNKPVENAIVFAIRQSDGKVFTGITNFNGEYCICVPKESTYTIECFCGSEDCFTDAPCICDSRKLHNHN